MDVPVNVEVYCADGQQCGRSTYVVLNPNTRRVTHVVVREHGLASGEYLVPLDQIWESTPKQIKLRCTKDDLLDMEPFVTTDYVQAAERMEQGDSLLDTYGGYAMWPYAELGELDVPVEQEHTPLGEIALEHGATVEAVDGRAGRIDDLLVDPVDGRITHLILRKGHLWGQRDITIPVDEIDRIEEDRVYLKLDKEAIARLPSAPAP